MFLTAGTLAAVPGIRHGFFTRGQGAVQDTGGGIYQGLNCGFGSADDAEDGPSEQGTSDGRLGSFGGGAGDAAPSA